MKIFGLERKAGFGIDFHQFNSSSALIGAYVRMKGYIWAVPDGRGLLLQSVYNWGQLWDHCHLWARLPFCLGQSPSCMGLLSHVGLWIDLELWLGLF